MKILYLNSFYYPDVAGGAEITLRDQVEGMKARGHDVVVLCTKTGSGEIVDNVNGVRVIRVGILNIFWHFLRVKRSFVAKAFWHLFDSKNRRMIDIFERVVKAEKPDIISLHNLAGWSTLVWHSRAVMNVATLQVLHDFYTVCPRSTMFRSSDSCKKQCSSCAFLRRGAKKLSNNLDAVIGVSSFALDKHVSLGYFEEVPVRKYIHNVRRGGFKKPFVPRDKSGIFTFGFLGSIIPVKGVEHLIKSFLAAGLTKTKLLIAGAGDEQYTLQLKHNYPSEFIEFLGYVDPPKDFFPQIDVLVVPSLWDEPLGMIVFEANSFGIPVLASRRGGLTEIVAHRKNGMLFEPTSDTELKDAMIEVYSTPSLIAEMGVYALEKIAEIGDFNKWLEAYESTYKEIL